MGTDQETPGVHERYCPNCRAIIAEEAVLCPECKTNFESSTTAGSGETEAAPTAGTTRSSGGTEDTTLLTVGSGVCAFLGGGSLLFSLLFSPFLLATGGFSLVGTVLGAVAYRRGSVPGLAFGVINALELLLVAGLVLLLLLAILGMVAIGLSGNVLVVAAAPLVL